MKGRTVSRLKMRCALCRVDVKRGATVLDVARNGDVLRLCLDCYASRPNAPVRAWSARQDARKAGRIGALR